MIVSDCFMLWTLKDKRNLDDRDGSMTTTKTKKKSERILGTPF